MPLAIEIIGTGETFTDIQLWEDALDAAHPHRGECKAEVFGKVVFSGVTYDSTNYPLLTSVEGAEHDGRAHEVSGAGNARIESNAAGSIVIYNDPFIRFSWMEVKGPGNNIGSCVSSFTGGSGMIHHNILHNNHAGSSNNQRGVFIGTGSDGVHFLYRNISYGHGGNGLTLDSTPNAAGSICSFNTIYECVFGNSANDGGIFTQETDFGITANGSFDNLRFDIRGTLGTLDYNATSDASGAEGANRLANVTTADQFVDATTTFADTDLLLKEGADLIGVGPAAFSPATYPEIDESIDNRGVSITGTWDIGAHQFGSAVEDAGSGVNKRVNPTSRREPKLR